MSAAAALSPSRTPPIQQRLQEKLFEFRFHALALALSTAAVLSLLRLGPGLAAVVSFFRPLLLSTAVFLAAVLVLRLISPPASDGDEAGVGLIDYVAGAAAESHAPAGGAVVDENGGHLKDQ